MTTKSSMQKSKTAQAAVTRRFWETHDRATRRWPLVAGLSGSSIRNFVKRRFGGDTEVRRER